MFVQLVRTENTWSVLTAANPQALDVKTRCLGAVTRTRYLAVLTGTVYELNVWEPGTIM